MKYDFSSLGVFASDPDETDIKYDLGISCVGYERRSRFVATGLAGRTMSLVAVTYRNTGQLAFAENLSWAADKKVHLIEAKDYQLDRKGRFREAISSAVFAATMTGKELNIWIDVSAMDRSLLARMFQCLLELLPLPFRIRVCYAPAKFVEPAYAFTPLRDCTPAIPELAGALGLPGRKISLLVGLGYEYGVALGLFQQIEPDHMLAFVPKAEDILYDEAVKKANFGFDFGIDNPTLVRYQVNHPVSTFDKIFAITSSASGGRSVIIVPNGPKIFASLAILIGIIRRPNATILRTSQHTEPPDHHIEAEGSIITYEIVGAEATPKRID